MAASDLKILTAPDGGHRRLSCRGVSIRLLTKEQIQELSPHDFQSFRKKFEAVKIAANLDEDWLWKNHPNLVDDKAFKSFDYLRHAISRENNRRFESGCGH